MRFPGSFVLMPILIVPASAQEPRLLPVGSTEDVTLIHSLLNYNGELVVAGDFESFNDMPVENIFLWDGAGSYADMQNPFSNSGVKDILLFDGQVTVTGYLPGTGYGVLQWNGAGWDTLGGVFNSTIEALIEHNGTLHCAGLFTLCGLDTVEYVAKWNGMAWAQVGNGLNNRVVDLAEYNGDLFAGGWFEPDALAPDAPEHIARLDGNVWQQVLDGLNDNVSVLHSAPNGLWIGGTFDWSGDSVLQLVRSARFDGVAFYPLLDPLGPNETVRAMFEHPDFGHCMSTTKRLLCEQGGQIKQYSWSGARTIVDHGGQRLVAGSYFRDGCLEMRGIAQIGAGSDRVYLGPGGIKAFVTPSNVAFNDHPDQGDGDMFQGWEAPKGSGIWSQNSHSLCLLGTSGGLRTLVPAARFQVTPQTLQPGPYGSLLGEEHCHRYRRVWTTDVGEIWDHAANWEEPGHVVPVDILQWPGNGDPVNLEPAQLAPFRDLDQDGLYEPLQGEFPLIKGDRAVYLVLNDSVINTDPTVGVNVHAMYYGHHPSGPALDNTLFANYRIVNRSALSYDTLYVGALHEVSNGNPDDDYVGCDTALNMGYTFNSDPFDEPSNWTAGYGPHPPAQGTIALNTALRSFYHVTGDPSWPIPQDINMYHNYLRGKSYLGTDMIDPTTMQPTSFMYSGDPVMGAGWTEAGSGQFAYWRCMFLSFGPFYNVAPGDTVCLDLAFVFAQDSTGDHLGSVALLKQRAAAIQTWYDQQPGGCTDYPALVVAEQPGLPDISIHPNPAQDNLVVTLPRPGASATLRIYDSGGALVKSLFVAQSRTQIDVSDLPAGLYAIHAGSAEQWSLARFIVAPY